MTALARIETYRPAPGLMVAALLRAATAPVHNAAPVLLFHLPEPEGRNDARDWAAERVAHLKRLFLVERLSYALIARRLGMSRGAVCGKVHRMGWRRESTAKVVARSGGRPVLRSLAKAHPPRVALPAPVVIEDPAVGVTLLAVKGCRWPIGERADGEHLFCDAPRAGGSYCCGHARKAVAR